jgi:hypothetical protein
LGFSHRQATGVKGEPFADEPLKRHGHAVCGADPFEFTLSGPLDHGNLSDRA